VGFTEYVLLALVILVPLAIAAVVTLWSLKQVQYRPKKRRPRPAPEITPAEVESSGGTNSSESATS
jgi:hypothetical protein